MGSTAEVFAGVGVSAPGGVGGGGREIEYRDRGRAWLYSFDGREVAGSVRAARAGWAA